MRYIKILLADHLRDLRGAEFKIAAYFYDRLERREEIVETLLAVSQATGVSWQQTQAAVHNLDLNKVLEVESRRKRGTCFRLPAEVKAKAARRVRKRKPAARKPPTVVEPIPPTGPRDDEGGVRLPAAGGPWRPGPFAGNAETALSGGTQAPEPPDALCQNSDDETAQKEHDNRAPDPSPPVSSPAPTPQAAPPLQPAAPPTKLKPWELYDKLRGNKN